MRPNRWVVWAPVLILLALAAGYIYPLAFNPTGVAFPPNSQFTDLLISHWPNAVYLRESLSTFGQVPLWNAQLFAGQPFAADPLAGLWYPPNWLLLFAPLAVGFNVLFWLHLALGGLGVYRLLRAEGVGDWPALLAGACFAGTPKLIAHLGAGHVSLVAAVAWTPWLLLATRRLVLAHHWRAGTTVGAALAITFLADVRWAYYAGWLMVGYGGATWWEQRRAGTGAAPVRQYGLPLLAALGVAALLAAPLALPLGEFLLHTRRATLTLAEAGTFSLPWVYLLGLLIPNTGGFHEYMTYLGVVPLLLAVGGLGRRTWFWAVVVVVAGLFALGTNGPLYPLLFRVLPGVGLLRVPPRVWFLVALAGCALAGHGAQRLAGDWLPRLAARYRRTLGPHSATWLIGALLVIAVLDLVRVDATLLEARPLPGPNAAAAWLREQPGQFRVYSPSYSLPPGDGLEHVDGVDPLQLSDSVAYIATATGIHAAAYNVTVPPFETADLAQEHANAVPDAERLGRLNVRYVAAEFDLSAPGLALVQQFGTTRLYGNALDRGRAWIEDGQGEVVLTAWSPDHIEAQAEGPGLLVLSEINYPGWHVTVDGEPATLETAEGGLRAVRLTEGTHTVGFAYRPWTVSLGFVLGLAGVTVWGLSDAFARRAASGPVRRAAPPPARVTRKRKR